MQATSLLVELEQQLAFLKRAGHYPVLTEKIVVFVGVQLSLQIYGLVVDRSCCHFAEEVGLYWSEPEWLTAHSKFYSYKVIVIIHRHMLRELEENMRSPKSPELKLMQKQVPRGRRRWQQGSANSRKKRHYWSNRSSS
jgi:hypothetical protein